MIHLHRFASLRRGTCARLLAGLALALSIGLASEAWAAPPTDAEKARAMERFQQGSLAFKQKRFKDAIDLFLEANAIVENAAFAYNTALAYEAMGDTSQALRWSREYLRRSPSSDDHAEVEGRIRRYELNLKEKGLMQVTVLSEPRGATVLLDGQPVGVTPWTGETVPGSHAVELRLRGYVDATQPFDLSPDHAVDVRVSLAEKPAEGPAVAPPVAGPIATAPPTAPPPATDGSSGAPPWLLPTSLAVLGTAVAGGAVAVGLEVGRAQAEQSARDAPIQVDAAAEADKMESFQLGARVAAGIAGGLALAGGIMLVVDLASGGAEAGANETAKPTALRVQCGPLGCGATVGGAF
ncbi:MAG TPA: PEGA domain-containing protein [Polyangiaceae bacterium]|nr:PEGA domain-containing protein [Polyangiaceae bacterium]